MKIKSCLYAVLYVVIMLGSIVFPMTIYAANLQMDLLVDGEIIHYNKPEITLNLDGISFVSQLMEPVELDGFTFVSAREVFEYFGAVVDWKASTREVLIGLGETLVIMQLESYVMTVNGVLIDIPAAPLLIDGNTMIPIRLATEAFGFEVTWDGNTQEAFINSTPATPEIPADKPVSPAPIIPVEGLAIDKSLTSISSEDHPMVRILSVRENGNGFVVKASGPISKVDKILLSDNRLIIDVYHAQAETSGIYTSQIPGVAEIRTSQFQLTPIEITRLVFDMEGSIPFQVTISPDRTEITLSLDNETIEDISFSTYGGVDVISITGTSNAPKTDIFLLTDPKRLVIDLPMSQIPTDTQYPFSGNFINQVRGSQFEPFTARIAMDLQSDIIYEVVSLDNITTITISAPTYKHIYYDYETTSIVIPKLSGASMALGETVKTDRYEDRVYILTVSSDISEFIGYGEYQVNDYMLDSFIIESNGHSTTITAKEKSVVEFILEEDNENYYFKARRPKDAKAFVVVIDPGHGANDPGTSGFGYVEKDLNLRLGHKVIALLDANPNITVYATRLDDSYPTLAERATFANEVGDLYISIHHNSFANPAISGTETYYYPHSNDAELGFSSQEFADIIHKHLIKDLGLMDRKVKSNKYIVLTTTNVPSILLEIGFLSNEVEARILSDPAFQDKVAASIYRGILEVMERYYP